MIWSRALQLAAENRRLRANCERLIVALAMANRTAEEALGHARDANAHAEAWKSRAILMFAAADPSTHWVLTDLAGIEQLDETPRSTT